MKILFRKTPRLSMILSSDSDPSLRSIVILRRPGPIYVPAAVHAERVFFMERCAALGTESDGTVGRLPPGHNMLP